jgi:hypothetical protein
VERLLQEFEQSIRDTAGVLYRVFLYGRNRPGDTWQGWLVFERTTDGRRFATDVETTQSNAEAVLYWATGLTAAYFDGALARAQSPNPHDPSSVAVPAPIVTSDSETHRRRLATLERDVLTCFTRHRTRRLLTQALFNELPYAHADVVRALEDLEKQGGLLIRQTEEGNDWLFLTPIGAEEAGVADTPAVRESARREPPRPA